MTIYEKAIMESKIESAENRIRSIHNDLESKKLFSKRNYLPYESKKFIQLVKLFTNRFENIN